MSPLIKRAAARPRNAHDDDEDHEYGEKDQLVPRAERAMCEQRCGTAGEFLPNRSKVESYGSLIWRLHL